MGYENKVLQLEQSIHDALQAAVLKYGKESQFCGEPVLKVPYGDYSFNLQGNRYLAEVGRDNLIDNTGNTYYYSVLSLDQIAAVADYLIKKK